MPEIEFTEESRPGVHTVRVNGKFVAMVVNRTELYEPKYEIHQWDDTFKTFSLYNEVKRWKSVEPTILEMVS